MSKELSEAMKKINKILDDSYLNTINLIEAKTQVMQVLESLPIEKHGISIEKGSMGFGNRKQERNKIIKQMRDIVSLKLNDIINKAEANTNPYYDSFGDLWGLLTKLEAWN
ncbi:MAG: hypothetical protein ACXAC2_00275 [Candidatus Kariarchaeaceae archaeon]|jgi:hypothetical protein